VVEVRGEVDGDLGEGLVGVSNAVGEAELGEDAQAAAGDGGLAGEGDDGDAHPDGVDCCRVASVGVGVEADVDLVVELEIVRAGLAIGKSNVSGIEAGGCGMV